MKTFLELIIAEITAMVARLPWEDLLYASYDGRTYCMPVMMGGPIVRQL